MFCYLDIKELMSGELLGQDPREKGNSDYFALISNFVVERV
jgi:hypothetical protein